MMYKDVPQKEFIKGMKIWKNKNNKFTIVMPHYSSDPDKDPDRNGKEWFEKESEGMPKAKWNKEYEIDSTTKSGTLVYGSEYCDFDPKIHFIQSFEFDDPVEYLISLDFGQRNPTSAHVGIWTRDNILYIVDEYYKPAIPSVSSREMIEKFAPYIFQGLPEDKWRSFGLMEKKRYIDNCFDIKVIDPTTVAKNRTKKFGYEEIEYSVIEEFEDNGWEFTPGTNDVSAGITRVREYFQLNKLGKAKLYIFKDKCPMLCWELQNYRYKEYTEAQKKTRNESEEIRKKDDHACDDLRLMVMTRPNPIELPAREETWIEKDIKRLLRPKIINYDDDASLN